VDVDLLAGEQASDEDDGFPDGARRLLPLDAQLGEARDPRPDAEHRPAAGDLVQRGDGHRRECRMARVWIGHAGPKRDARRVVGDQRERRVRLAEEPLVRQPEVVVAGGLRELCHLHEPGWRIVRQEQEAGLHGSTSSDQMDVV
jgi:hypothetical protein